MTKKSKPVLRPAWAIGLDPVPVPYIDPFRREDEAGRHGLRPIAHVAAGRVPEVLGQRSSRTSERVPARDIMTALLQETREGFWILWPPWPSGHLADHRRSYLAKLARYHEVRVEYQQTSSGDLLVRLKGDGPRATRAEVRRVSPIEAERMVNHESVGTESWLRPSDDGHRESRDDRAFEPYYAYLRRLLEVHGEDLGAGVVYPYHRHKEHRNQQIRLHQEAERHGCRINLRAIDKDHVLITIKSSRAVDYDPRRRYEREADEPAVLSPSPGRVVIAGEKPTKMDPTPIGSMEDL